MVKTPYPNLDVHLLTLAESGATLELGELPPGVSVVPAAPFLSAIKLDPDTVLDKPIILLHQGMPPCSCSLSIQLGARARATVVEAYLGPEEFEYSRGTTLEVTLDEGAELVHLLDQREGGKAVFSETIDISQASLSRYQGHFFNLGADHSRLSLKARLLGEGAECGLAALSVLDGERRSEIHTSIDHVVPDCRSSETVKTILNGSSLGSFHGRVSIQRDAQRTDSKVHCKNLLLSASSTAKTRPEMEIYADDVKASHGATTGQLDSDALFFLQARGISKLEARKLLTLAFAQDMILAVRNPKIRETLQDRFNLLLSTRASCCARESQ